MPPRKLTATETAGPILPTHDPANAAALMQTQFINGFTEGGDA
jgi:hypothetical protein